MRAGSRRVRWRNTFLLALALGAAASTKGSDLIVEGLGLVSLIALAPVLSVMTFGLLVVRAAELTEPSRGLAFVVALEKVVDVSHLRNEQSPDQPS